ncbi:Purine catabolism regulatory protein [Neomoorella glycerini]|uniref:Purine catabolism regulatory protein n=1 Tax=Neomoorella glycerini TaxID=55779 RepID=A0A6I5ZT03_9FIRM|nr:helix-turn-helix domain-containing protein [Moorella glycerini]QGP93104.1 Purine catabolism regulatory protein [Moorella glycerini]
MPKQLLSSLLVTIARNEGLTALARLLAEYFRNPVIITDAIYRILTAQSFAAGSCPFHDYLPLPVNSRQRWPEIKGKINRGTLSAAEHPPTPYIAVALGEEKLEGFIFVLEVVNSWHDNLNGALLEAALPIVIEIKKEQALLEIEQKYKREFVLEILYNNFEDYETIVNRGKAWGWNLAEPWALMVLQGDEETNCPAGRENLARLYKIIASFLEKRGAITIDNKNQMIVLVPYRREQDKAQIKTMLANLVAQLRNQVKKRFPDTSFSVGIADFYASVTELYRAFQEAKTALKLGTLFKGGESLTYFSELGIIRLLYKMGELELRDYWQSILGPLREYDRQHESELLATLKIYFRCDGDQQETARRLFIHPNTLKYRLKKIEEITALNLNKVEAMVNLYLALQVMHLQTAP